MKPTSDDLIWLSAAYPGLVYEQSTNLIRGELRFVASYDKPRDLLLIEGSDLDFDIRTHRNFINDVFEISIDFDAEPSKISPWPSVSETGGRKEAIAKKLGVALLDLHMFSNDGSCCLTISYAPVDDLAVKDFIEGLVVPFFYRLSYVERHGTIKTTRELWGEYSHGKFGLTEFDAEMQRFVEINPRVDDPCPCGSTRKFKLCCRREFVAWKTRETAISS